MDLQKKKDEDFLKGFLEEGEELEELEPLEDDFEELPPIPVKPKVEERKAIEPIEEEKQEEESVVMRIATVDVIVMDPFLDPAKPTASASAPVAKPKAFGNGKAKSVINAFFLIAAVISLYLIFFCVRSIYNIIASHDVTRDWLFRIFSTLLTVVFAILMIVTGFLYGPKNFKKMPHFLIAIGIVALSEGLLISLIGFAMSTLISCFIPGLILIVSGVFLSRVLAGKVKVTKATKIIFGILVGLALLAFNFTSYPSGGGATSSRFYAIAISLFFPVAYSLLFFTLSEEGAEN